MVETLRHLHQEDLTPNQTKEAIGMRGQDDTIELEDHQLHDFQGIFEESFAKLNATPQFKDLLHQQDSFPRSESRTSFKYRFSPCLCASKTCSGFLLLLSRWSLFPLVTFSSVPLLKSGLHPGEAKSHPHPLSLYFLIYPKDLKTTFPGRVVPEQPKSNS